MQRLCPIVLGESCRRLLRLRRLPRLVIAGLAGDTGKTRLSTGEPVDKWHPRVTAYGTVDETNAALGVAGLYADGELLEAIRRIQNDLFDLGADLATPDRGKKLARTGFLCNGLLTIRVIRRSLRHTPVEHRDRCAKPRTNQIEQN